MTSQITNNKQLSVYIEKVRSLAYNVCGTDFNNMVYATLISAFNNCDENEGKRAYYATNCNISSYKNNRQAIDYLIDKWMTNNPISVEGHLRTAQVMIADNRTPLPYQTIQSIIAHLNNIAVPEQKDIDNIVEDFKNSGPIKTLKKSNFFKKLFR